MDRSWRVGFVFFFLDFFFLLWPDIIDWKREQPGDEKDDEGAGVS